MNQSDRIAAARMSVLLNAPFFASLLMRLKMERDDSVPTFCTDGRVIKYNEAFSAQLDDAELRGVLVHETLHCALGHLWRMAGRDPRRWNCAADYAINAWMTEYAATESKFVLWTLPEGGLLDPQYAGMSSEAIYNRLPRPKPDNTEGYGNPQGAAVAQDGAGKGLGEVPEPAPSCGEFEAPAEDAPGEGDKADNGGLEAEWAEAVSIAATLAQSMGTMPGCVQRLVRELLAPRVTWRDVLREFIRLRTKEDYCWSHPNRRHIARGIMLPSLHSERMGRIVFGVDTSGSIDQVTLTEFATEIQAALDECRPEAIEVIYCDAAVNGAATFEPGDAVALEMKGGGGTRFAPVFEHIAKMDDEPVCLIYLTDLEGSFPKEEPGYPVLWAYRNRRRPEAPKVPFGEIVSVN